MFDIAISLGKTCQSRYNISRTLYKNKYGNDDGFYVNDKNNKDYGTFFFDWNITPINSVVSILRNQFSGVLEIENLCIKKLNNGKQTVLDDRYGCSYPHAFPETREGNCTYESLRKSYGAVKEKYNYLIEKTVNTLLSNQVILFVLTGNHAEEEVLELCIALEFYTSNYKILFTPWNNKSEYLENYQTLSNDERFIVRPIVHSPYPGNLASWDEAFDGVKLRAPV